MGEVDISGLTWKIEGIGGKEKGVNDFMSRDVPRFV